MNQNTASGHNFHRQQPFHYEADAEQQPMPPSSMQRSVNNAAILLQAPMSGWASGKLMMPSRRKMSMGRIKTQQVKMYFIATSAESERTNPQNHTQVSFSLPKSVFGFVILVCITY